MKFWYKSINFDQLNQKQDPEPDFKVQVVNEVTRSEDQYEEEYRRHETGVEFGNQISQAQKENEFNQSIRIKDKTQKTRWNQNWHSEP